ncbi:MAG: TolC family protein [Nitrospirota bacterium]|nr:TolC family protein [Nitrospirota bacterium]MDE3226095.1 TolC family protein [Nitrospirota bacterium]MDE3243359.1 TolC family protein [Nitrospirota bacterium]
MCVPLLLLGVLADGRAAEPDETLARDALVLRLSLREAMEAAVDHNPKVQLFKERIREAHGVKDTKLGALLPNLSGSMNQYNQTFFLGTIGGAPVPTTPFDIFDARATATQYLFSKSLVEQWKASRISVEVAEMEAEITKRDTMATTALAYIEALRAQEAVRARQANVELFRQLVKVAREKRTGGMASGLDTARAEAHLENERQRVLVGQNDLTRAKLSLMRAIGLSYDVPLVLTGELSLAGIDGVRLEEALAAAEEYRVEVKAQAQRIKVASLTLDSTVSERWPSLQARGDFGRIGNAWTDTVSTHNVGVVLSVPVFDGGQREGRIYQSRSQVQQEILKLKDVLSQVALEVRDALDTLVSSKEQVLVSKQGLQAAMAEMELARERFTVLSSSNAELTTAQISLARARENAVDALYRFNASRVNLARAQGRLDLLY